MICNFQLSLSNREGKSKVINSVEGLLKRLIREGQLFKYDDEPLIGWYQKIRSDSGGCVPPDLEALYSGFFSNSVGQAFVSAYELALQRLTGVDTHKNVAAFCVTENKSTHPASMQSSLLLDDKGLYLLSGKKDFVTLAGEAKRLFVAVTFGVSDTGRSIIKLVEVDVTTPGVNIQLHPELPFVSEVSHGVVSFDSVIIEPDNIFSGDGYADYVKPFRWLEDVNVFMSVSAYLFKLALAFDWSIEAKVEMMSLLTTLSGLHKMKVDDSIAHIVMFDQTVVLDKWLERYDTEWNKVPENILVHWKRDLVLLKIATRARKARYNNAVTALALL